MWLFFQPFNGIIIILIILISTNISSGVLEEDHLEYAPQYEHPEYAFSYGVKDLHTGDVKSQWESRDGGVIKGHYSVREPDGSIRTVDYTADAKNGFNAVVKTHGPNSHPVTDTPHSQYSKNDDTSQSKINHYSKDQEHIVLSSDLRPVKRPINDISHTHQKTPSLIEIRPHARIKQIPMESIRDKIKPFRESEEHYYKESEPEIRSVKSPDLTKYKRVNPYDFYDNEDTSEWKAIANDDVISFYDIPNSSGSGGGGGSSKNIKINNKYNTNSNNNHNSNNNNNNKYNNHNNNNSHYNNSNNNKKNENINHYNKNYYRDYEKLQQQQFQEDYFSHRKFNYKPQQPPPPPPPPSQSENYPIKSAQISSLRTDFISSKPYQNNANIKRPSFNPSPEIPPKKNYPSHQNPSASIGHKHHSSPKKIFNSKRHKNVGYSSYFQRQGKSRPINNNSNNKEGPVVFPNEDEFELREAASARMVQSMLGKDKKHMVPGYASLVADRYFGA